MDHFGIVRADEQAITGSALGIFNIDTVVISLATISSSIYKHILSKSEDRWRDIYICKIGKWHDPPSTGNAECNSKKQSRNDVSR